MYKKMKKEQHRARDFRIEAICSDLIKWNEDTTFLVSKKFVVTSDKKLGNEINGLPIVISTTPINELVILHSYKLTENGELTTWCDENDPLVKLVYSPIKFTDGEINGKKIPNMYLDIEADLGRLKKYKSF